MNYTLTSNDLLKENWVKVEFYPEMNDAFEKVVKDECWELANEYGKRNVVYNDIMERIEEENTHNIYIPKESLCELELFVDEIGDELFNIDLDISWNVYDDEFLDNELNMACLYVYDEDCGYWEKLPTHFQDLMI